MGGLIPVDEAVARVITDLAVLDCGPDGFARIARDIARRASALQSGYLYHYAFAMLIGIVVLVTWYLSGGA